MFFNKLLLLCLQQDSGGDVIGDAVDPSVPGSVAGHRRSMMSLRGNTRKRSNTVNSEASRKAVAAK